MKKPVSDMAASIPVEMQQNLLKISAALKSIDEGVKELTNAEVNVEEFSKLEQARHHLTLCYVMCSEFWILLKINGIDTTEHPITQEMVRIKRYIDRMNEIERKDEKPSTRIDANAASRMIAHTADLDQDQRRALIAGSKRKPNSGHNNDNEVSRKQQDLGQKSMNPFKKKLKLPPASQNVSEERCIE